MKYETEVRVSGKDESWKFQDSAERAADKPRELELSLSFERIDPDLREMDMYSFLVDREAFEATKVGDHLRVTIESV